MFDYDWFHGPAFLQQQEEAKARCVVQHCPDLNGEDWHDSESANRFHSEIEARTLIYLRDGFSYEVKQIAEVSSKSHLVFECEPVDDRYKVGAFVVTVPFDEIVRVEVFAVHPDQKPDDLPQITGFRSFQEPLEHPLSDVKPAKPARPRSDV